jgi:hypothetical protein
MTTRAGLTLLIVGIILLFAVHLHIGFISLPVAGVICVVTAVLGWGLPRYRPGWTARQRARLGDWLDPDPEAGGGARVPLTDILATPAAGPAAAPVAAPQPPAADVTDPDLLPAGEPPAGEPPVPGAARTAPPTWPAADDPRSPTSRLSASPPPRPARMTLITSIPGGTCRGGTPPSAANPALACGHDRGLARWPFTGRRARYLGQANNSNG